MSSERTTPKANKAALLKDIVRLAKVLESDDSRGACLPGGVYWSLRCGARDARRFLQRRQDE